MYFMLLRLKHELPFVHRWSGFAKRWRGRAFEDDEDSEIDRDDMQGDPDFEIAEDEMVEVEDEEGVERTGTERVGRPVQRRRAKRDPEDRKRRPATRTCKKEVVSLFYQLNYDRLHYKLNYDWLHNYS